MDTISGYTEQDVVQSEGGAATNRGDDLDSSKAQIKNESTWRARSVSLADQARPPKPGLRRYRGATEELYGGFGVSC